MAELKVEILLPLYYNPDGSERRKRVEGERYSSTYNELYNAFGGCSIDRSPLIGMWRNPKTGKMIKDENVTYFRSRPRERIWR